MPFRKLSFKNTEGQVLGARLDLPAVGQPIAYALFAHCFTCTKNLKAIGHISRGLTDEGIAVLRFDFTGLGESEGDFADTNFSSNVSDLVAAADFLNAEFEGPKILIGHSLGGAAVLLAAAKIPTSAAVATIGAPADPRHVTHLLGSGREKIEAEGEAEVVLAGRKFKIKKQFLDDLEESHMEETIRNLEGALLIFHSPIDNIVGIENATWIFKAARHPKSFVSLDEADHLLSHEADSVYVGAVCGAWARKYIDPRHQDALREVSPEDQVDAVEITRLYTGPDGQSHFEETEIPLEDAGEIGRLSKLFPATGIIFRQNTPDYDYDWHNAPRKQYIIMLDGEVEIEVGDGSKRRFRGGDILLAEDTDGHGHRSRIINNQPRRSIFVVLD